MARFMDDEILVGGQPDRSPTLGALTLSSNAVAVNGTLDILGATPGSTITGSNLGSGVTLDSANRKLTFTEAGSRLAGASLSEVLAGATNTPRASALSPVTVSVSSETGAAALSNVVIKNGNSYTFTATRTGDTSGSKTVTWAVGPSALPDQSPAISADFGGNYPTFVTSWIAGEVTSKTFVVTPVTNAQPE